MAVKSVFNRIIHPILIGCFFWIACGDIPRDNALDPLNPDSTHPRKHLIEAFVNISDHPSRYNQWMLEALNDLEALYEEDLVIAIYHRSINGYPDDYASPVSNTRYNDLYEALDDEAIRGVPDVFINGTSQRIQGASDPSVAFDRLQAAVHEEFSNNHKFYMNVQVSTDMIDLTAAVTLSRLGNQDASNLRIQAMIISEYNGAYRNHVVQDLEISDTINHLDEGEIKEIQITGLTIDPSETQSLVIAIMNDEASYAYQADVIPID